jgi:hypothetical protein
MMIAGLAVKKKVLFPVSVKKFREDRSEKVQKCFIDVNQQDTVLNSLKRVSDT